MKAQQSSPEEPADSGPRWSRGCSTTAGAWSCRGSSRPSSSAFRNAMGSSSCRRTCSTRQRRRGGRRRRRRRGRAAARPRQPGRWIRGRRAGGRDPDRGVRGAVPAQPAADVPDDPGGAAAHGRGRRRLDRVRRDPRRAPAVQGRGRLHLLEGGGDRVRRRRLRSSTATTTCAATRSSRA